MDLVDGIFNTGTATVAANGTTVTFQNAPNLQTAVRKGDRFGGHRGLGVRILAVGTNTVTLAAPWPGPAQTAAAYEIVFSPYDLNYRKEFYDIIERYGRGALPAMAELALVADTLPYGNGTGSMALTALTEFARTLLDDENAAAAQATLGGSAVGRSLFTAANAAAARAALALGSAGLQNYEVGTFSPTLEGVTTPGTPDYVQNQGAFVKFGRLTLAHFYIVRTSMGGAAGTLRISGLPFAIASGAVRRPLLTPSFWNGITLPAGSTGFYGFGLTTDGFTLYRQSPSNSTTAVDASMVTGTVTIYASAVYEAAS